jgi:hypothetical protein
MDMETDQENATVEQLAQARHKAKEEYMAMLS